MTVFDPIKSFADMRHEFGEHGGVNMSIEASTTFTVLTAETMPEIFHGQLGPEAGGCYLYGRHFNPTVYVLGRQIAAIEGAQAGYCTASGLAAISATLLQLCNSGDHIVAADTIYGGTHALLNEYLPAKANIHSTRVPVDNHDAIRAAFKPNTKALYVESIANPTMVVADIPKLAEIAHEHSVKLVVDNTFTPMILSPIQLGADIVVHSMTKFINGASDIIAGAVCASTEFIQQLMDLHTGSLMLLGPTMDPKVAAEVSLRLPHLAIRMTEHSRRALAVAQRLDELGLDVIYPGLESHPHHALLNNQRNEGFGFGGLLALDAGSESKAFELMETLQNKYHFGFMAVSLGFFDTLMSCSGASTSSEMSEQARQEAGIAPGLVRLSMGLTGTLDQRHEQLESALRDVKLIK